MKLKPEITKPILATISFICLSKGPHYAGINIYNNLPIQIMLLSSNFNQVKKAL
jgi:hypothetical protein